MTDSAELVKSDTTVLIKPKFENDAESVAKPEAPAITLLRREVTRGYFITYIWLYKDCQPAELLKKTLSTTLRRYRVLAGRYDSASNGEKVLLTDEGASFRTSTVDWTLSEYAGGEVGIERGVACALLDIPDSETVLAGKAPLLTVTVTEFHGGGSAVGVAIFHPVCDGSSLHRFMAEWSTLARAGPPEKPPAPLTFDRGVFHTQDPDTALEALEAAGVWLPSPIEKKVLQTAKKTVEHSTAGNATLCVFFSSDDLTQLRTIAEKTSRTWISRHEALSAHISQVMAELWVETHTLGPQLVQQNIVMETRVGISSTVNVRNRPDSGVPNTFFGNAAIYTNGTSISIRDCTSKPLGELAQVWHDDLAAADGAAGQASLALTEVALNRQLLGQSTYLGSPIMPTLVINNRSKFPAFAIDFGAGVPVDVIPHHGQCGIKVYAAADGGCRVYFKGMASVFPPMRDALADIHGYTGNPLWGGKGSFWFQAPPVEELEQPRWLARLKQFGCQPELELDQLSVTMLPPPHDVAALAENFEPSTPAIVTVPVAVEFLSAMDSLKVVDVAVVEQLKEISTPTTTATATVPVPVPVPVEFLSAMDSLNVVDVAVVEHCGGGEGAGTNDRSNQQAPCVAGAGLTIQTSDAHILAALAAVKHATPEAIEHAVLGEEPIGNGDGSVGIIAASKEGFDTAGVGGVGCPHAETVFESVIRSMSLVGQYDDGAHL